jgi:putative membrane protein
MRFLVNFGIRLVVSAVALLIVAYVVSGVHVASFASALGAAIVLGLLNALLRPLLVLLTLPITVITLGLFLLVINAGILLLTAALVPGFEVHGFWAAFLGAIVLWLVGLATNLLLPEDVKK